MKTMAAVFVLAVAAAGAEGPAGALADLAWMAGSWEGRDGDALMEETWLSPRGGTMLGLHRDVVGSRTVSFEFLRIEASPEGVVYWASPQGAAPTPFRLVESGARRAVFANPAHDFPKRILYWLDAEGALHARIDGDAGRPGKAMEWTWRRAPLKR